MCRGNRNLKDLCLTFCLSRHFFSRQFALDAWATAPRGGMIQILIAIGLIEMVSNRFTPRP